MPPIERIVVLMMENHSFDRVLGWMKQIYPGIEGVDPKNPLQNPDFPPGAQHVIQAPTQARAIPHDPGHDLDDVLAQLANANQGFVADYARKYPKAPLSERQEVMGWYERGFLPAIHYLAESFVVCDHWFSSMPGPTWPNRFFVHSGTSLGHVDMPEGLFNPAVHVYDQETLYDELDKAKVDWRIYHGDFSQSLLLTHQLTKLDHYSKFTAFADDVANNRLPPYVFIEPAFFGSEENDQHPPQDVMRGDALIASVFNALHANKAVFEKTLLVILYDEHGGFFDHVSPPATVAPDAHTGTYAFDRLGVRVPAILVSPWLDPGFITPVFDHTSLLKMACQTWGVAPLGSRTAQAHAPLDALRWRQAARTDIRPAPSPRTLLPIVPQAALTGQKQGLYAYSQYLESQIRDPKAKANLMLRAHDALTGAIAQGTLATERQDAFMTERKRGG
ncbi:MAG TPA: alkaline phosphatase family protein [Rhodopila sp.]|uniref:phospholipase C n=1 Tax=Rhodopila sp. TaxID=2480087 RepID=UPI002C285E2A|nr:alkaline phosphatase family protein [Rhodopila sp.]HVY14565.1 alkaline phosphatase family protein [Rhodopila sp.]